MCSFVSFAPSLLEMQDAGVMSLHHKANGSNYPCCLVNWLYGVNTNKHLHLWPVISGSKWFTIKKKKKKGRIHNANIDSLSGMMVYMFLSGEMVHETICIPAVCPFLCGCSIVRTSKKCSWPKISLETVAMQQHNTALIQTSNFTVRLLFFPKPAAALCYVHIHRDFWILGGMQVSVLFVSLNYVCLWCHCSVDRQRKLCFSSLVPHPHSPQFPRPGPAAAARPQTFLQTLTLCSHLLFL